MNALRAIQIEPLGVTDYFLWAEIPIAMVWVPSWNIASLSAHLLQMHGTYLSFNFFVFENSTTGETWHNHTNDKALNAE